MTLEPMPPSPEEENLFGGWLEIAATIGRFISPLPGLPGGSVIMDLLAALTGAQDTQTGLLKSIKADTAALRMNPFRVALQSLQDAQRVGPAHPSWGTFIRRAEDKFIEASKLVSGPQEALVEFNLTIVYLMMEDEANTRYHAEQSVQCADRVVDEYVRSSGTAIADCRILPAERTPKGLRARDFGSLAVTLGTVAITLGILSPPGSYLDAMTPWGRRALRDLERFIGFYNLIQRTASSISGDAQPRYLVLSGPDEPLTKGLFKLAFDLKERGEDNYPYVLYTPSR
jgi:hypothetical protein